MRRNQQLIAPPLLILDGLAAETFDISFGATSIASLTMKNVLPGQMYVCLFHQDAQGGRTVQWGPGITNAGLIDPTPNTVTVQTFIGTRNQILQAVTPATWNEVAT